MWGWRWLGDGGRAIRRTCGDGFWRRLTAAWRHGRRRRSFGSACHTFYKALIRRRRTGEASASSRRGHRPRKLTLAKQAALAGHITAHPDLTLAALQTWLLDEHGVWLSNGAMWSAVERLGLSFKKRHCAPPSRIAPTSPRGAGSGGRRSPSSMPTSSSLSTRNDPALRSRATRQASVGPGPVRPLEDHHLRRRIAARRPRRADGARRPDDRRGIPRLRRASADPDARTGRHRRDGQPAGP